MYCYHCGKELSSDALMCPNCGAPTKNTNAVAKQEETATVAVGGGVNIKALSVVGIILSTFGFVTGIIFGAFFFTYRYSVYLLYILSGSTILPALAGLSIGVYVSMLKENNNYSSKACAVCSIVFSSIVLAFLFIGGCIIAAGAL